MDRVLIIIPAHNEAEAITTVIEDIKQNASFADVLVINDYSTDRTASIVRSLDVSCIDNIFNVGYAWSVQTGIKYAYQNHYDYVIQMDADGQHLASESRRLYEYATAHHADIVIGSRYLQDTGYHCPFFRRLGTKIFSGLVKLLAHQRITDPLSGFQCLSRRVIQKYAQMGEYPEFPDANLIIEMILRGYRVAEIPVKMRQRQGGQSMHSGIIKPISYMLNMFYAVFIAFLQHFGFKRRLKEKIKK